MDRPITHARRRWLVLGLCAGLLLVRAYVAIADQGMVWADEIFQTLEQGHRLAFGYGLVPWEFKVGARSWLLPGVLGGGMKALAGLGVGDGATLAIAWKLVFAALGAVTLVPILRMAQALGGPRALVLGGLAAAALPVSLVYGSRVLAEVASAPFIAWGVWLLLPWGLAGRRIRPGAAQCRRGRRVLLAAGLLLGCATILRYQNGALLPAVLVMVALRAGLRPAAWLGLAMGLALLGGGLLDFATWGRPFHSLVVYLRFNLIESGANQWGIAKRGFYLRTMLATNGPMVLLLAAGALAGLRRTWPIAVLALLYLAMLSAVPHKELRFVFPVLPLFVLCGAVGMAELVRRLPVGAAWRRGLTAAMGLGMVAIFVPRALGVTFADLGQAMDSPAFGGPTSSLVWRAFDERNRLLAQAGKHADLCGLAAPGMNPYWAGGYTYLHRRVPLLWTASPAERAAANYLLASPGPRIDDARYREIAKAGPYTLLRRDGACAPPPRGSGGYGRLTPLGVPGS